MTFSYITPLQERQYYSQSKKIKAIHYSLITKIYIEKYPKIKGLNIKSKSVDQHCVKSVQIQSFF